MCEPTNENPHNAGINAIARESRRAMIIPMLACDWKAPLHDKPDCRGEHLRRLMLCEVCHKFCTGVFQLCRVIEYWLAVDNSDLMFLLCYRRRFHRHEKSVYVIVRHSIIPFGVGVLRVSYFPPTVGRKIHIRSICVFPSLGNSRFLPTFSL